MKFAKKMMAGLLVVAVFVAGAVVMPKTADAAESVTDILTSGVMYVLDEENYNFSNYWSTTASERKVPVKAGHVFGGWYQKVEGNYVALKESSLTEEGATTPTDVYAKFVPSYVMSVMTQNEYGTVAGDGAETSVRVVSSVDSRNYKNVGFDIWLNNAKQLEGCEATEVYVGLMTGSGEGETPQYASDVFGTASTHFSVWRLDNIHDDNDSKIIYVRPYWTTMDGTRVEGLAEYVHIEDGYKNFINVPVNLTSGEAVAAGKVKMTYDSGVLTCEGVEAGRVFAAMSENHATAGTVSMVGNITVAENGTLGNVAPDGIYANVRFSVNENQNVSDANLQITVNEFCNLAEAMKTVTADITH